MSLEMLCSEAAQGCKKIFLTHNSDAFEWGGPENVKFMYIQMKRVQDEAERISVPLQIYQGCDVRYTRTRIRWEIIWKAA